MVNKTLSEAAAPATVEANVDPQVARYGAPRMRFDGTGLPTGRGVARMTGLVATAVISNVPGDPLWSPPV